MTLAAEFVGHLRQLTVEFWAIVVTVPTAEAASRCMKICCRAAETTGCCALPTALKTLRIKWTLQRCQLLPVKTAAMAFLSP